MHVLPKDLQHALPSTSGAEGGCSLVKNPNYCLDSDPGGEERLLGGGSRQKPLALQPGESRYLVLCFAVLQHGLILGFIPDL